ncbi:unnamed protein product [Leuciscus chuanchicus]
MAREEQDRVNRCSDGLIGFAVELKPRDLWVEGSNSRSDPPLSSHHVPVTRISSDSSYWEQIFSRSRESGAVCEGRDRNGKESRKLVKVTENGPMEVAWD